MLIKDKPIGERVKFSKNKQGITVEITQQVERIKETMLITWLAAWTFCGAVFIYFLLTSPDRDERIMLGIMLGLWSYFEFRIGRVFIWRRMGREVISITPGLLTIENRFWRKGKVQRFNLPHVKKFGLNKEKSSSFLGQLDQSFWVMGGDRFSFSYMGKQFQFGKQLGEKDTRSLAMVLEKGLREFSKSR